MAGLVRTDPLVDLERFDPFRRFEDLFGGARLRSFLRDQGDTPTIRMDVSEDDTCYRVKAEIPGVKKEDIRVSIDANLVSISAQVQAEKEERKGEALICSERSFGSQTRSFSLRHDVDPSQASAKYVDGVLELVLPKSGNGAVREIAIQ